jgi:hypothetical protein
MRWSETSRSTQLLVSQFPASSAVVWTCIEDVLRQRVFSFIVCGCRKYATRPSGFLETAREKQGGVSITLRLYLQK